MSEERKWKRGEIGPDGRIFWAAAKHLKSGEHWVSGDKYKELLKKNNKRTVEFRLKNPNYVAAASKKYREKFPEKCSERTKDYYRKNKKAINALSAERRSADPSIAKNKTEAKRRRERRRLFLKADGSSLSSFLGSVTYITHMLSAIMSLTPDRGQSLAELIFELSGYEMSVCQEIANLCTGEIK